VPAVRARLACLVASSALAACSGAPAEDGPAPDAGVDRVTATTADAGAVEAGSAHDGHEGHEGHGGPRDASADAATLAPGCDEDNALTTLGVDRSLPAEVVQFARRYDWGCLHREYHDTRQWDIMAMGDARYAARFAYAKSKGWTRAAVQEGAPGSGLDFLAMHRAMLGTLRASFPQHARLFAGWTSPPLSATTDDPLPSTADGGVPAAMSAPMTRAVGYLQGDLSTWSSEDSLGLYIQSDLRPTAANPLARSTDPTAGVHAYLHVRFDDSRSAIRMQRFSRNLESEVFWKLHGWIDATWTRYRRARTLSDSDPAYVHLMHHACMHMGLRDWDAAKSSCVP